MSNFEIVSDFGLREDGRRPNEVRGIYCNLAVIDQADGSAYFKIGNTKVLAAVYGPRESMDANRNKSNQNRGTVNCQYSMTTFSGTERRSGRSDLRLLEINADLNEIFETVIATDMYPNSQIDICIEVLQSDGSNFNAAVNAASLALLHAGIGLRDIVCSCSAGYFNNNYLIDLNYTEESLFAIPHVYITTMPKSKRTVSIKSNGRISLESVERLMEVANEGCQQVFDKMTNVVSHYVKELNS